MNPPYKRKILFISKEFQGRMIFNYFVLTALGSLIFIGIFSFFSSNTLSIVYDEYQLQLGTTPGILFKEILSAQWMYVIVGGFLISFITLHLTHRVAGPFYRFEKSLDEMISGKISGNIVLRHKDEGKILATKINGFNEKLSGSLVAIEGACSKVSLLENRISMAVKKGQTDKLESLVKEIRLHRESIEDTIHEYTFKTGGRE